MSGTIVADFINASTPGGLVQIDGFGHVDPVDPSKIMIIGNTLNNSGTIKTAATLDRTVTFASQDVLPTGDFVQNAIAFSTLKINGTLTNVNTIGSKNATTTINGASFNAPSGLAVNLQPQNSNSSTILKPTATSGTVNITLPSVSATLIDQNLNNNFTQLQTFQAGIQANAISPIVSGNDIVLAADGIGNVIMNGPSVNVDTITAKTVNSNLSILSNGTGLPIVASSGLKFANSPTSTPLSFYKTSSFTASFGIGAFTTGILTLQYEIYGKRVTVRVPPASGTPAINGVWTSSAFPTEIMGVGDQRVVIGGLGIVNNSFKNSIFVTIKTNNTIVLGCGSDIAGFGTTGVCGWTLPWSYTYLID